MNITTAPIIKQKVHLDAGKTSICLPQHLSDAFADTLFREPEESFCFVNQQALRKRVKFFQKNFLPGHPNAEVAYAVKANPRKEILEIMHKAGLDHFDCASWGEIKAIQNINSVSTPFFNHPIKRNCDIASAWESGVRSFTVQDWAEAKKILTASTREKIEIVVRVRTPPVGAEIHLAEKFGAEPEESLELLKKLGEIPRVERGLAMHVGSQLNNPNAYRDGIDVLANIADQHQDLSLINLGGGMPVNYHPHETYNLDTFLDVINDSVRNKLQKNLDGRTKFLIEPGRAMIAEAIDLTIPVLSTSYRDSMESLYVNDGIFTCFSDTAIHGWNYFFNALQANGDVNTNAKRPYRIFGRTCDSGDVIPHMDLPTDIHAGDFLWVPNAGAYLDAQCSDFNGYDPPKYTFYN